FGIIMVVNLALGMITPPFGVNLFAACAVANISLDKIIKHLLGFVLVIVGCLGVITYVPSMSLYLRDVVYAKVVEPVIGPAGGRTIGPSGGAGVGPSGAP